MDEEVDGPLREKRSMMNYTKSQSQEEAIPSGIQPGAS